jgi:SOS response associated peptidase (SRAP)
VCGRLTQKYTCHEIRHLYELVGDARNLQVHYNIAPTDTVEVVRLGDGGAAELVPMRWGFVPYWWKKQLKQVPATWPGSILPLRIDTIGSRRDQASTSPRSPRSLAGSYAGLIIAAAMEPNQSSQAVSTERSSDARRPSYIRKGHLPGARER